MSKRSIGDIVASLQSKTRFIGLKSPQNFDIETFEHSISARCVLRRTFEISRTKNTHWVFTLYEFHSDECIVFYLLVLQMAVCCICCLQDYHQTYWADFDLITSYHAALRLIWNLTGSHMK